MLGIHPEILGDDDKQEQEDNQESQKQEKVFFFNFSLQIFKQDINTYMFCQFTQQEFRKKLLRQIVADDQPFVTVEKEEFCEIIKYLWPGAIIPTADTLRSDLNSNFSIVKTQVRETLQVSN